MRERYFYYALILSLSIHILLLSISFFKNIKKKLPEKDTTLKITVKEFKVSKGNLRKTLSPLSSPSFEVKRSTAKLTKEKFDLLAKARGDAFNPITEKFKDVAVIDRGFKLDKKEIPAFEMMSTHRKIEVPFITSEKITNSKYLSYNDTIRQKIKERAYKYVNNPAFQTGEVYLTFVLTSKGSLKDIKIIESKTHANEYLREVGIKSIKESSPFPSFPQGLDFPELSFNVVISFKLKEK